MILYRPSSQLHGLWSAQLVKGFGAACRWRVLQITAGPPEVPVEVKEMHIAGNAIG